jgi:hypothetical protein
MHDAESRLAEADGTVSNRVEDWLHVSRRLADNTQDFACRGLLSERLSERAILLLQFAEQPHILDSDDGLIGESLEQRHLPVGKRADLLSEERDHT